MKQCYIADVPELTHTAVYSRCCAGNWLAALSWYTSALSGYLASCIVSVHIHLCCPGTHLAVLSGLRLAVLSGYMISYIIYVHV